MKKILKKIVISTIVFFLIMGAHIANASDDEEPLFPNGVDISRSVNLMIN